MSRRTCRTTAGRSSSSRPVGDPPAAPRAPGWRPSRSAGATSVSARSTSASGVRRSPGATASTACRRCGSTTARSASSRTRRKRSTSSTPRRPADEPAHPELRTPARLLDCRDDSDTAAVGGLVPPTGFKPDVPGYAGQVGSIPMRCRHFFHAARHAKSVRHSSRLRPTDPGSSTPPKRSQERRRTRPSIVVRAQPPFCIQRRPRCNGH